MRCQEKVDREEPRHTPGGWTESLGQAQRVEMLGRFPETGKAKGPEFSAASMATSDEVPVETQSSQRRQGLPGRRTPHVSLSHSVPSVFIRTATDVWQLEEAVRSGPAGALRCRRFRARLGPAVPIRWCTFESLWRMKRKKSFHHWLRLEINPIIQRANEISGRVQQELPSHAGIIRAAAGVVGAAEEAKRVAHRLSRPWGLHRLPVVFLALALLCFSTWIYWQFLYVSTLRIAVPEEDAVKLQQRVLRSSRVKYEQVVTPGSRDSVEMLTKGQVDVAFVQGGIPVPVGLPRLRSTGSEAVLYFVRDGVSHPHDVRRIMTSTKEQGSHSVAKSFVQFWQIADQVQFTHEWRAFNHDVTYQIPADVDAVFVVKDMAEHDTLYSVERLSAAGFQLTAPDLGAHATTLDYLQPTEIPRGYLGQDPLVPDQPIDTYGVATYLVARADLTPRLLSAAAHLMDRDANTFSGRGFEPTIGEASEVLQGMEAFLGVLVYMGLAFLALLGLEIRSYRRRFNELNTLVSLLSMHQSDKDVLGLACDALRRENLLYLSVCSDLAGLISVIGGYYAQMNPSLLYSNLLDIIQRRCDGLKLNIQIKILHASVCVAQPEDAATPGESESADEPT